MARLRFEVGARVESAGHGVGTLAVDNEDGTWNVDFDDGSEDNVAQHALQLLEEVADWAAQSEATAVSKEHEPAAAAEGLRSRNRCRRVPDSSKFLPSPAALASCCMSAAQQGPRSNAPGLTGASVGQYAAEAEAWLRGGRAGDMDEEQEYEAWGAQQDYEIARGASTADARRTRLSFVFLLLIAGPGSIATLMKVQDWWKQPTVHLIPPGDSALVERIFSGGQPWLVSCVTRKSGQSQPPKPLMQAAALLQPKGIRVARLHCWETLELRGKRETLASRYGFRSKPPVVMVSRGMGTPMLLASKGLTGDQLAAQVLNAATSGNTARPTVGAQEATRPRGRKEAVGKRTANMEDEIEAEEKEEAAGQESTAKKQPQATREEEDEEVINLDS